MWLFVFNTAPQNTMAPTENGVALERKWVVIYNDQAGDDCSQSDIFDTEEEAREFLDDCEWKAQLVSGYGLTVEDRT